MHVTMQHRRTGETKEVKIGFSWTLLLFSGFFGVPLFLRGLNRWAEAMLVFSIVGVLPIFHDTLRTEDASQIGNLLSLGSAIYLAFKGNELTAKAMLADDWRFANEADRATDYAKMRWSIS